MDAVDAILMAEDLVAVLGRDVPVGLVDISTSGCLLESRSRVLPGATGSLAVTCDGERYEDDVRVIRCRVLEGSSGAYQIGAEFLWTTVPHERSLRRIIPRLRASAVKVEAAASFTRM